MTTDPNDFLLAGGIPSAKFPTIGTLVKGTITNSEVTQQTDLEGKPKSFDDGNPMMQVVITLQTDERDSSIDNDEGLRKLYVKGQMKAAIAEALRGTGSRLANGGTLAVKFDHEKPAEKRGHNPAKQYVAQYAPPAAVAANDLLGVGAAAPTQELVNAGGVPANDLL